MERMTALGRALAMRRSSGHTCCVHLGDRCAGERGCVHEREHGLHSAAPQLAGDGGPDDLPGHWLSAVQALLKLQDVLGREERRRAGNELPQLDVGRAQPLKQLAQHHLRNRRSSCCKIAVHLFHLGHQHQGEPFCTGVQQLQYLGLLLDAALDAGDILCPHPESGFERLKGACRAPRAVPCYRLLYL